MSDETLPEGSEAPQFPASLRGYDRNAVDAFIAQLNARVGELEAAVTRGGVASPGADANVSQELEAVSAEVGSILEAARAAAEGMRSRAAEDAARWRADADRDAREMRKSAEKASEAMRSDAWNASTEMLEQADHDSAAMLETARQDALYVRAEAEREALRLTGDARRDAEEAIRAGKTESERLAAISQAEAQTTLDNARRSAETAQERARALERRRGELMEELETARRSIGEIEGTQAARAPSAESMEPSPVEAERSTASQKAASEWLDGDASVRIVPATLVPSEEPVDADSFVAEVERLRSEPPVSPPQPEPRLEPESAAPADAGSPTVIGEQEVIEGDPGAPVGSGEAAVGFAEMEEDATVEPDVRVIPGETLVPGEPVVQGASATPGEPVAQEEPQAGEAPAEPESASATAAKGAAPGSGMAGAAQAEDAGPPDELDSLFATLRDPDADGEAPTAHEELAPLLDTAALEDQEPTAVEPEQNIASLGSAARGGPESVAVVDAFDLKDRMLLPIENRALRSVKRRIVDLQNRVLEELRVADDGWDPDRALFTAAISDEVTVLTQESYVAGYAAAADLVGATATPPPDRSADQDATTEFVDAALADVVDALKRSRATGGGVRQVSAAVSRVFRAWRTDEAERRLRRLATRAYHAGILDAMPGLDVERVGAVTQGTPCGECPAGSGVSWSPGEGFPSGTKLPPANPNCAATIVPVGA